jgi:hypothetical protein
MASTTTKWRPGDTSDEKFTGSVQVYRDQIHITNVLAGSDSLGHRAQVRVRGILEPRPKGREPVWVVLENVYGRFRDESMVDDQGGFQLNYIWGKNVILVCAGSEVLFSGLVNVGPHDSVTGLQVNLKTGRIDTRF